MRLWNLDHSPAVIAPNLPGVKPGESHDFTVEEIEAGVSGVWSKTDPRKGLEQEKAFKGRRDEKTDMEE
jgi:hypothetical protein